MRNESRLFVAGGTVLIGLVALGLRVWGAGWSLPYVDHPDEPAIFRVLLRMNEGDLNPKHFFYPSLILYLQALVLNIHLWWGHLTGLYSEAFELPNSTFFYTTIPRAFVWARVVTALLGTGTVVALATWGGRLMGRREGLLAAALLALSPWAVIHDHYITVDGPSALTGTLALLAALQVLRSGSWRDYVLAGVLVGLAAGTKYQNVLVAASVALAHLCHWRGESLARGGRLAAAGAISAAVFLLTTPYIVLAPGDFWHDIQTLLDSYSNPEIAHGDVTGSFPVGAYLRFYWRECLGPLPFVLALVGGGMLVRRRPAVAAVLLLFPLLMLVSLLRPQTHFYRNLLPTLPPLLLLAGVGGVAVLERIASGLARSARFPPRRATLAVLVLCTLVLLPSLLGAVQASARLAQPDSRVLAQEYLRRAFPGVRVASELSHPMRWDGVAQSSYVHYLPLHPPSWYREQGYGVLLANEGRRGSEDWTPDYAPLLEAGNLVATFGEDGSGMLGPRLDVIETGLTPEQVLVEGPRAQVGPLRLLGATVGHIRKQGNQLRRVPGRTIEAGRTLALTAFWTTDEPIPPGDYMVFVHFRDTEGRNLVQRDARPWQGLFPLHTWPAGGVVVEELDMWLPYEIPPGQYRLVLGLYESASWVRYPAAVGGERVPNNEVDLGVVEVVE